MLTWKVELAGGEQAAHRRRGKRKDVSFQQKSFPLGGCGGTGTKQKTRKETVSFACSGQHSRNNSRGALRIRRGEFGGPHVVWGSGGKRGVSLERAH